MGIYGLALGPAVDCRSKKIEISRSVIFKFTLSFYFILIIITFNVCLEKKHRFVRFFIPGSIYKLLHSASFLFAYTNVKLNARYIYIRELICDLIRDRLIYIFIAKLFQFRFHWYGKVFD